MGFFVLNQTAKLLIFQLKVMTICQLSIIVGGLSTIKINNGTQVGVNGGNNVRSRSIKLRSPKLKVKLQSTKFTIFC